jgi:peptidoglycan/xylan/chitin deacetylase (PgdA/CDA1 family)
MSLKVPGKYHRLAPFEGLFQSGVPILMYHKIGRRPPRVRLKGLYVSPERFAGQLRELKEAGFATTGLEGVRAPAPAGGRQKALALTFDDGYRNVFENATGPMAEQGFHGIQFLVTNFLGGVNEWDTRVGETAERLMDEVQVREWMGAGHEIGSHSLSHPRLTRLSVRDAREEIVASRKKLEDLFGRRIRHFCYPYGDWNEAVRELVVEAGYETASSIRFGVNTPETSPYVLCRIMVRHPTRSLRALRARLFR